MRVLTILVILAGLLYGGYWVIGHATVQRHGQVLLQDLQEDGYNVSYADLQTRGFPSRFDTTVTDIAITDPTTGYGWHAPFFQVLALSYQPNRVIVVWPERQEIELPGQSLSVTGTGLRASMTVGPSTSLPLDHATVEAGGTRISADLGWEVSFDSSLAAVRRTERGDVPPNTYDVFADMTGLTLPQKSDPATTLASMPTQVETIKVDGSVTLDRPIDRFTASDGVPRITQVELRELSVRWGTVSLSGNGSLEIDALGMANGRITVVVTNWRQIIDVAANMGIIPGTLVPAIVRAAEALGQGGDRLEAPLTVRNGFVSLGPLPLGPAPRFR